MYTLLLFLLLLLLFGIILAKQLHGLSLNDADFLINNNGANTSDEDGGDDK